MPRIEKERVSPAAIVAVVPWFGTNRQIAGDIVALLGRHSNYWEPFCGSCACLLAKPRCAAETVNDLHGDLVNLARVVADDILAPRLYGRLAHVVPGDDALRDAAAVVAKEDFDPNVGLDVDRAAAYFTACWLGRNGFAGTVGGAGAKLAVRWTGTGGHGGVRFASAVESIPAWWERLRRVMVLRRDGFGVLAKVADHPKTAIYVDPPFIQKSLRYVHDFAPEDHGRLADLLKRFRRSRVVVRYYARPELDDLYPADRWRRVRLDARKNLAQAAGWGSITHKAPETLLVNDGGQT